MGYLEQWEADGLKTPEFMNWLARFREDKLAAAQEYWHAVRTGIMAGFADGPETIPNSLTPGQQAKLGG